MSENTKVRSIAGMDVCSALPDIKQYHGVAVAADVIAAVSESSPGQPAKYDVRQNVSAVSVAFFNGVASELCFMRFPPGLLKTRCWVRLKTLEGIREASRH